MPTAKVVLLPMCCTRSLKIAYGTATRRWRGASGVPFTETSSHASSSPSAIARAGEFVPKWNEYSPLFTATRPTSSVYAAAPPTVLV